MTQSDKRKASAYMKKIMADQSTMYSIYPLYQKGVIDWVVFQQLMFKYYGLTKDEDKMTPEQRKHMQNWGKRYKKKRDEDMNRVLMEAIGDE